jgi:hypothetical protein
LHVAAHSAPADDADNILAPGGATVQLKGSPSAGEFIPRI